VFHNRSDGFHMPSCTLPDGCTVMVQRAIPARLLIPLHVTA
jgi:hypothetical protein